MKHFFFFLFLILLTKSSFSQKTIPNISITDLNNTPVVIKDITNNQLVVLNFWATWCLPCIKELNTINDAYAVWQNEVNFKLIAVSIDDNRTVSRVRSLTNGNDWEFKVLLDKNQKLKRALQISNIPYTLIVKNGEIVFRHTGFIPGNEEILFEKLKKFNSN